MSSAAVLAILSLLILWDWYRDQGPPDWPNTKPVK